MNAFNSDSERLHELRAWLKTLLGERLTAIEPASADASFRRYFRVFAGRQSFVCMDAPVGREDTAPFIRVAGLLGQAGLNVPDVLEANTAAGFLLLRDLGATTYLDGLRAGRQPDRLYRDAIAALVRMQSQVSADALPGYSEQRLRDEMALFTDWFTGPLLGLDGGEANPPSLQPVMDALADAALCCPQGFVHRDFHSRNLMICDDRNPGVLDFQDACHGPLVYDLVSLLRDSYVQWPRATIDGWIEAYRVQAAACGIDTGSPAQMRRSFDLVGAQRHLKVCGIFARLYLRDGKADYLRDIPLTFTNLQNALRPYKEFAAFRRYLQSTLAAAMPAALRRAAVAAELPDSAP